MYYSEGPRGTSGFELYRDAIRKQFAENHEYFGDRFIDVLRSPSDQPGPQLSYDNFYLRISVDIVSNGARAEEGGVKLKEGISISATTPLCLKGDPMLGADKSQVKRFDQWREQFKISHSTYRAIGIVLEFRVHYKESKVFFGMQMGLPLLQERVENLRPRVSWWKNNISSAFGDYTIRDPDPPHLLKYLELLDPSHFASLDLSALSPETIKEVHRLHGFAQSGSALGKLLRKHLRETSESRGRNHRWK